MINPSVVEVLYDLKIVLEKIAALLESLDKKTKEPK